MFEIGSSFTNLWWARPNKNDHQEFPIKVNTRVYKWWFLSGKLAAFDL